MAALARPPTDAAAQIKDRFACCPIVAVSA
jgi:hypothetical protein